MSKEQSNLTPIEIIKIMVENKVDITIDHVNELLNKGNEQREELIKEAFVAGFKNCESEHEEAYSIQEEAEQYYNEVIKPKLNK